MEVGQTLLINSSGGTGHIVSISESDGTVDINWKKHDSAQHGPRLYRYHNTITYDLIHIEELVKIGTLVIRDGLPPKNPNLLFKLRGTTE